MNDIACTRYVYEGANGSSRPKRDLPPDVKLTHRPFEALNQCMGCQAGWPTKPSAYRRTLVHEVVGGYPHELVGCTRERYR